MDRKNMAALAAATIFTLGIGCCSLLPTVPRPEQVKRERFVGTVELYMTSWCPQCKKAREFMDSRHIAYRARDVESDPEAAAEFRRLGGRGVPLIVVGSRVLPGFSPQSLSYELGL